MNLTPFLVDPATNTALWTWDFLASTFGASVPNQSPTGGAAYTLNLRFPGQYFDGEAGLNYNYFRNYEPTGGRYIESDPIGLFGGKATYGYALQRPLSLMDPLGLNANYNFGLCIQTAGANCTNNYIQDTTHVFITNFPDNVGSLSNDAQGHLKDIGMCASCLVKCIFYVVICDGSSKCYTKVVEKIVEKRADQTLDALSEGLYSATGRSLAGAMKSALQIVMLGRDIYEYRVCLNENCR